MSANKKQNQKSAKADEISTAKMKAADERSAAAPETKAETKTDANAERSGEEQFLSSYSMEDYERPSVTADIVAVTVRAHEEESYRHDPRVSLSILLVKRGVNPYINCWALPGGFLKMNETIEACAYREVREECNLEPVSLMPVGVFSEVERDPRGRIISNAFMSVISSGSEDITGGDDAADARWFDVSFECDDSGIYELTLKDGGTQLSAKLREVRTRFGRTEFKLIDSGRLAFDHAKIIAVALSELRRSGNDFETALDFLPEKFTLTALQRVQEVIANVSLLPANFRKKAAEYVVETDEFTTGSGHRPAKLFMRRKEKRL